MQKTLLITATYSKSVGVGVMDAAISALVLEKATELSEYGEVSF